MTQSAAVDSLGPLALRSQRQCQRAKFRTKNQTSEVPPLDKFDSKLYSWQDHVIGSYTIILGTEAIVSNLLVLAVAARRRKFIQPQELLLVSLAISDLGVVLTTFPMMSKSAFNHRWAYGDSGCRFYACISFILSLNSMCTLVVVAWARFIVVCYPKTHSCRLVSFRSIKTSIVFTYAYAIFWSICPLIGWGEYDVEPFGYSCTIRWVNGNKSYIVAVTIFCCFVPIVAMASLYCRIAVFVSNTAFGRDKRGPSRINVSKRTGSTTKAAIILCISFVTVWFPYAIVSLWSAFGDPTTIPLALTVIPVLLAKASTGTNPLIYSITSSRFRQDVRKLFVRDNRKVEVGQELSRRENATSNFEPRCAYAMVEIPSVAGPSGVSEIAITRVSEKPRQKCSK